MPKLKARNAVVKRFKVSSTGKLMHEGLGLNHLMRKKSGDRKRNLKAGDELYKGDRKRVTRMLGQGL